ncbi:MAG: hypothetical protein AAGG51_20990 [Cyanobacteria bacterium P01_G01_bin.54]
MVEASSTDQVVFVANHLPPLLDGNYTLSLEHELSYGPTVSETSQTFKKTRTFAVAGERFLLKPNVIRQVFPPANGQEHFDNVLPHVVFSRRTLPWERIPDASAENHPSWLAILVFPVSDAPKPTTGTLADLYPSSVPDIESGQTPSSGTLPSGTYSYGNGLSYFLGYGESPTDACVYLDIPQAQFARIAPSRTDLAWNAHGRTLEDTKGDVLKDYAAVVANRLPMPGANNVAHLVSLEGLGDQLPQDDGSYPKTPAWTHIRLVSLKSWSLYVSPLDASFAHILQGLNGGMNPNKTELGDCQIRLPSGYVSAVATKLNSPSAPFDSGYTVLKKSGREAGTAWYRGPFVPSIVTPLAADASWSSSLLPANKASDLVVAVSTTPARDLSLAAAWELGRLLALADRSFATAQVAWKRQARLALNAKLGQANELADKSRAAYAQEVRAVLADAREIQTRLGTELTVTPVEGKLTLPQALVDWLGRSALLTNVPFDYLVPDNQMLPPESLKFFNLDPRWLACLLDGAWSLGRQPRKQWAFDTAYQPWRQILEGSLETSFAPKHGWPASGAILHSQLIPDYWPGIRFSPTPSATILREADLGSSTLLLLFDKELTALEIG